MQVLAISKPRNTEEARLLHSQHQLRARIFSDRLGWEVNVAGGCESDAFDDIQPTYILAVAKMGRLAGCARLLPTLGPTMVANVFPSLLSAGQLRAHSSMVESSRFCVETSLSEGRGDGSIHEATLTMFAGIIEWSMANRFTEIVTVTDIRFERILARVGWPLRRLGEPRRIGVTMAVAGTLPANADTFMKLRPANYRSNITSPLDQAAKEKSVTQLRSHPRLVRKLQEALGDELCVALDDSNVVEIMLNPDGKLFIERLGHGVASAGEMSSAAAEMVIGTVAHALQSEVDTHQPIISGELPIGGHRFEGLLPPVVAKPAFTIRRRASRRIPLDDYVRSAVMTEAQAATIRRAIASRLNIIISGGTGSGKTTLANAVIHEIVNSAPEDRLVILEDTAEIQCAAENAVLLHTTDAIDMARLLKSTMRLRPDRIVVGEVRDGAALTLLKAWNTGHPGGVATIHSNTANSALRRLEQLTAEASQQPMQEVIGEAVDLIVSIERTPRSRRVRDIIQVERFANGQYEIESDQITEEQEARHVA